MELNLTIIADYMTGCEILFQRTDWRTPRLLKYPVFYNGERMLESDRIYIAQADRLMQDPAVNGTASLLCLGYPPDLRDLFDSHYILVHDASIYQVINISKSQYSSEDLRRRLKLFLNNNNYIAGLSIEFEDFSHVWMYMQQAMAAAEYHEPTADSCIFQFEKNVLYILLQNAKNGYASEFYFTNSLRRLFQYDRKNHADLVKTLKVYLENNLSIPRTQEQLHIARTTCLYRIQRIENISRLNLKLPDTQLYLLLLFRLMDI